HGCVVLFSAASAGFCGRFSALHRRTQAGQMSNGGTHSYGDAGNSGNHEPGRGEISVDEQACNTEHIAQVCSIDHAGRTRDSELHGLMISTWTASTVWNRIKTRANVA